MPQIVFTATALRDLERLREFLRSKNPPAAQRAACAIINTIRKLESYPDIGRPIDDNDFSFRELLIDFGDTGYLAMYQYDGGERLTVLVSVTKKKLDIDRDASVKMFSHGCAIINILLLSIKTKARDLSPLPQLPYLYSL